MCKSLWEELNKLSNVVSSDLYESEFSKIALRLDFTMSFYQLNCLLVDSFHDPDYFARNSKIDTIIEYKPAPLPSSCLDELKQKLHHLDILK